MEFRSFFMGGFECSTHVRRDGRRLDLLQSTRHDRFALADYRLLRSAGIDVARDGIRWHRIEDSPGRYQFDTARPQIEAMQESGIQVIWDLLHFGWPDHVDPFSPDFPKRLGALAYQFAECLRDDGVREVAVCPVNEISFLSFAGGQTGFFNPFAHQRGDELKRQLVKAALSASRAVRAVHPNARLVHTDPIIHVAGHPRRPEQHDAAEAHRQAQYASWDRIAGRIEPELGGAPEFLDVLGVNYYVHNQWVYPGGHGSLISPSDPRHRPLQHMLLEVWERYRRPLFIAETGIENAERPAWLAYVGHEVRAAMRAGADLQGICIYPIVNHPGWDDDRHCQNGLWDYADDSGHRAAYAPLLDELRRQQDLFERMRTSPAGALHDEAPPLESLDEIARSIAEVTESSREG
jgi:hypothetical protein